MSDTPTTDGQIENWKWALEYPDDLDDVIEFARELERELAEAKKKYLQVCAQHGRLVDQVYEEDGETLKQGRLNAELEKEQLWGKSQSVRAEQAEKELATWKGEAAISDDAVTLAKNMLNASEDRNAALEKELAEAKLKELK